MCFVDVSENRSGSSLLSEEKEARRQKYFDEGMQNFNGDIKKIFTAIGKPELYRSFSSDASRTEFSICPLVVVSLFMLL